MTLVVDAEHHRRLIIRASAGSGKTFQLALRFIRLLAEGRQCDEILATTFTRKAAGEILGRVVTMLAHGAMQTGSQSQLDALMVHAGVDAPTCNALLVRVAQQLHRMRVCTLDSFFAQIARNYSLELGLPPSWRIVDELQDEAMRRAAIEQVLREQDADMLIRLMHLITKGNADRGVARLMLETVNDLYQLYLEAEPQAWTAVDPPPLLSDEQRQAAVELLRQSVRQEKKSIVTATANALELFEQAAWDDFLAKGVPAKLAAGETRYNRCDISPQIQALYDPLMRHASGVLLHQLRQQTQATHELLRIFDQAYRDLKQLHRASLRGRHAAAVADGARQERGKRLATTGQPHRTAAGRRISGHLARSMASHPTFRSSRGGGS